MSRGRHCVDGRDRHRSSAGRHAGLTVRSPGPSPALSSTRRNAGYTLVELTIVVLVMAILGASVAMFIANPVRAYFDTIARAALGDAADTAIRRIARDLQAAVPNSVRVTATGGTVFLEFVPIVDSGRWRRAASSGAEPTGTDPLDLTNPADASFQVLGPTVSAPAGAQLILLNLGSSDLELYAGGNRRTVASIAGDPQVVSFVPAGPFAADTPDPRFFLATSAVTYACTPRADGTGTLDRYAGYPIQAVQPAQASAAPLAAATHSLVADNVAACSFEPGTAMANLDALQITLALASRGERVTLYAQVHTSNAP